VREMHGLKADAPRMSGTRRTSADADFIISTGKSFDTRRKVQHAHDRVTDELAKAR
jgi:hypothetical protein